MARRRRPTDQGTRWLEQGINTCEMLIPGDGAFYGGVRFSSQLIGSTSLVTGFASRPKIDVAFCDALKRPHQ